MIETASGLDSGASVLDRLSADSLDRLLALGQSRSFEPGAMVLDEGGETPFLGVLEAGRIALRLRVPELGHRVSILTIEPGELLGWSALVPPYRTTVDAVASEPAALLAIDAGALRRELASNHDLAAELLPIVLETLSARLAASWHQLLDLFAARTTEPW
jgi:CRP/FNR family transcriptional regulator, cyclic AMP receptor protein